MRIEDYSHPDDPRPRRKLVFACPKVPGRECEVLLAPWPIIGAPTWTLSGDERLPTIRPSINCGRCGWHGHITKGVAA